MYKTLHATQSTNQPVDKLTNKSITESTIQSTAQSTTPSPVVSSTQSPAESAVQSTTPSPVVSSTQSTTPSPVVSSTQSTTPSPVVSSTQSPAESAVQSTTPSPVVSSTQSTTPSPVVSSRPEIIRNPIITDIKTTSISLNWTQPVGNVAFYTVQWSNASGIQNSSTSNTFITVNGLTPGTQYTFSITAFAADNQTSGATFTISQCTRPDVIRNPIITEIKTTSISLNWTQPVGNVAFYTVQWSNASGIQNSSTSNTFITVNGLTPGTQYTFSITAFAADNQTSGATFTISQYTRPEIIRNPIITDIKTTSISLNWTQPVGNVAFYTVQWSNASGIQNSSTSNTFITVNGLTPGTQYTFSITAFPADNQTSGATFTISQCTRPDVIRNLIITEIKTTSISLNWTQPVGNVAFYTVQWSNASGIQNSSTSNTFITVNGLTPGTQYTFNITAFAADNQTSGATFTISQYTRPKIIRNPIITDIKTTSISLNWTQPVGNVAFYTVQWSNASGIQNSSTSNTFITVNGLTPGTQYTFSITAFPADNQTSGATFTISQCTRPEIIRNPIITDIKTTSISLNWTQPVGNVAFYTVQWSNASGIQNSSTSNTFITVNGLTPGTQYTFSITAFPADNQTSGATFTISQCTRPDVIRNPIITEIKTTSISLNWTQPVGNVAFYTVQWSNASGIQNSSTSNTFITVNGLTPGTQYTFSITAFAADNQTSGATFTISQYTRPEIIRNPIITDIKTTSISLNWTQPVGNVAFYTVQWSNASGIQNSSTSNTFITVNGLTPGTQYTFSITAFPADNQTSGATFTISQCTRPEIIRNPIITDIKTTSISLNWTQPVGNVAFYTVQWSNASGIQNSSTSNTFITVNGLTPGTQYTFSITAFPADNQTSGATFTISQFTRPEIIRNPIITDIKTTSISLNWTQPVGNVAFYTVQWSNASGIQNSSTSNTFITVNGLTPGTQYTFSITAFPADNQTSGATFTISQFTRPEIIRNPIITDIKTTSISLNWTQPVGNVAFYTVQWSNASGIQNSSTSNTFITVNGLTPGTQYTFSITAFPADNQTSGATFTISQFTRPEIIRNPIITDIKTTSISLNWTQPVGNVAFYTVQWSNASGIQNSSTSNTFITVNGLTPGTQYTFSITAFAADNQTSGATFTISQYTRPEIIRNPIITDIKTTSISLNWTQPVGNVAFYTVQWSNASGIQNSSTSNTFITVNGLTPGTQYTFSITAFPADNQTSGATFTISQCTRPEIIRNPIITDIKTTSISLNWTQPVGNVAFYTVQWSNASGIQNSSTSNTFITVNGLTPGTQYTFSITAFPADNQTSGATFTISQCTRPDVIRNPIITEIKTTSISLNWTQPVGNVAFYTVQWSNASGIQNSSTSNTFITVNGLTPGTQYTFSITAFAADNQTSGATFTISQYTRPEIIRNPIITDIKTTSISLNWTQPVGNVAFYTVQWSNASGIQNSSTSNTFITVNGLTPGTQYTFSITAFPADNQTSGATFTISQFTRPEIIRNPIITDIKTTSISLNWTQPVGNVAFYTVQWSNASGIQNSSTSNTFITVNGLTPGTQYTFSITAFPADNQTSGATFTISQFTRPEIIRNPIITDIKTTSISLNWTQPVGNVAFYTVQWSNASGIQNSSTSNTFITVNGLTPGTQYTFSITAFPADNQTSGATFTISQYTRPEIIRNPIITDIKTTSISLNWTQPVGNVAFYTVQWSNASGIQNSSTSNTFITVNGLTPGTQYTFSITAFPADNQTSGATFTISQFTRPEIIRNPINTDIKTTSISLNWTQPVGNVAFYTVQWSNASGIQNSSTSNTFIMVNGLTPGTQYTFSITAFAADNQTSGATFTISQYTRPEIIRNPIITDIKTTSISLNWTQPVGNVAFYTVQWSNASGIQNSSTSNTFITVNGLTPGTQYTFSITAFPADNQTSGATFTISQFTRPYSAVNLTSTSINTSSISLIWMQQDAKDSYSYLVQVLNRTKLVKNLTTNTTSATILDLESGSSFTFSVTTQAADGTTSTPVSISESTDAAPPLNFSCSGPNGTSAELILTWNAPTGSNQGFTISLLNVTEQSANCCQHTVSSLSYNLNYAVIIWTLGPGKNSTKENRTCTTGITKPPTPNIDYASVTQCGHQGFVLELNSNFFSDIHGPVTSYGVLIALQDFSGNFSEGLVKNYNNWKDNEATPYLAVVKNRTEVRTKSLSDATSITIGDKAVWEQYYNGPLTPRKTYRVAVVLFTQLQVQNSLINPALSLFTVSTQIQVTLPENPAVIGGIVGGILAVLIILIVTVAIFWRRRTKNNLTEIPIQAMRAKVSIPVRVEDYETYFKKQHADSNCGFAEEFEDLKTVGVAQSKTSALAQENKAKNRYNNVLPYDFSRVKLSVRGNPWDDYINANYIPGYSSKKEFIATQGPLPGTLNDFWRMIWEKNIHTLVMLTRCNEQGRVKCEKYWPSDCKHFDNIIVTNTSDVDLDDWTIRDFSVKNVKTAETRFIRQFHFTAWPDHGVPETTELLINFRYLVREHMNQFQNSPAVVHCSAGVGRTGTFIAIDRLIYQIEQDGVVDVFGTIHNMRMHRTLMVQTEDQYVFLNQCVLDIIKSRSGTNVDLIYQNTTALAIYENIKPMKGSIKNSL
ncbi:receptor-type tyrosine-protein phosphatase eta-like isoform X6 [Scleropages formosus]|uniref:receptor-type tyrosine-protein phosphatase eta-like isoform X6 n=1 Tax=Scleropages formosus TaxID=113540 RepID=UPI0010FA749D|nr:receptor-type tyrosine-protein phosphatase eta-like isoform X6 [Scleropages formosus]